MRIEVVSVYTAGPAVPVPGFAGDTFIPFDGVTRVMYGFTGGRGGPLGDDSKPWSDKCVCNMCAVERPERTQQIGAACIGGPGQFVRSPASRTCAVCGVRA